MSEARQAILFIKVQFWISAIGVGVCLLRLCFKDWPVVIKYQQWEYVLKVAAGAVWAWWAVTALRSLGVWQ